MSRKANYVALGLVLSAAIGLLAALKLWEPSVSSQSRDSIQLSTALNSGDDDEGYARAFAPRSFRSPKTMGRIHNFARSGGIPLGNLDDRNGRPFGYQLTFFRICMSSKPVTAVSPWQTNEFYTAHFALSDITAGRSIATSVSTVPPWVWQEREHALHVWLDNWSVEPQRKNIFPLRLRATQDDVAIDLMLEQGEPPVLQGDQGLSQKSAEPGNASYYYSLPACLLLARSTFATNALPSTARAGWTGSGAPVRWGTMRWVGTGIHSSSPTSAGSCSIASASATVAPTSIAPAHSFTRWHGAAVGPSRG